MPALSRSHHSTVVVTDENPATGTPYRHLRFRRAPAGLAERVLLITNGESTEFSELSSNRGEEGLS